MGCAAVVVEHVPVEFQTNVPLETTPPPTDAAPSRIISPVIVNPPEIRHTFDSEPIGTPPVNVPNVTELVELLLTLEPPDRVTDVNDVEANSIVSVDPSATVKLPYA